MTKVLWHVTMSLDGFIAGPDELMRLARAGQIVNLRFEINKK